MRLLFISLREEHWDLETRHGPADHACGQLFLAILARSAVPARQEEHIPSLCVAHRAKKRICSVFRLGVLPRLSLELATAPQLALGLAFLLAAEKRKQYLFLLLLFIDVIPRALLRRLLFERDEERALALRQLDAEKRLFWFCGRRRRRWGGRGGRRGGGGRRR